MLGDRNYPKFIGVTTLVTVTQVAIIHLASISQKIQYHVGSLVVGAGQPSFLSMLVTFMDMTLRVHEVLPFPVVAVLINTKTGETRADMAVHLRLPTCNTRPILNRYLIEDPRSRFNH